MKCEIVKILAEGTYKSFMTIEFNGFRKTIYISREFYYQLKDYGVPTAQSLRRKK